MCRIPVKFVYSPVERVWLEQDRFRRSKRARHDLPPLQRLARGDCRLNLLWHWLFCYLACALLRHFLLSSPPLSFNRLRLASWRAISRYIDWCKLYYTDRPFGLSLSGDIDAMQNEWVSRYFKNVLYHSFKRALCPHKFYDDPNSFELPTASAGLPRDEKVSLIVYLCCCNRIIWK